MAALKKPATRHKPKAEMNVVPYIDVMLVLLVIFMVTAPMLTQGVALELPKVAAQALPTPGERRIVTLSVKADGSYYWHLGSEVDTETRSETAADRAAMIERVGALVEADPETQIYVRADENADYGRVVSGIAGLQREGITRLGLITEAPE
ncbi:protein TolR [Salinicola halophilus]|uniref:protein TolR n=1 Tax=Salinicola halophilus TaxID=184065 RepID=UPI001EF8B91C|nr:protein TolR [Salinicola halophilus]